MEYMIVMREAFEYPSLERRVNELILQGWKPQGGVSVCTYVQYDIAKTVFAQAMVKE